MNSKSPRITATALVAAAALALPATALAVNDSPASLMPGSRIAKQYMSGSTATPSPVLKDYSKNSATGDTVAEKSSPTSIVTVSKSSGFQWGDAAIGAAAVALLIALLGVGAGIRRRHVVSGPTAPGDGLTA
jgi:hypothetical protein